MLKGLIKSYSILPRKNKLTKTLRCLFQIKQAQQTITYSKSTIEKLKKAVKCVQS